jgi:hypothetical protein
MHYKFLLEMLRSGLCEEFWSEVRIPTKSITRYD